MAVCQIGRNNAEERIESPASQHLHRAVLLLQLRQRPTVAGLADVLTRAD